MSLDRDGITASVCPTWRRPRCSICGSVSAGYDQLPARRWTHLPSGMNRIHLEYAPRRVNCRQCRRILVEAVPWARARSRFTRPFEELVAWLVRATDKTTVTELLGVSWKTVGAIIKRVVVDRLPAGRLDNLRRIGVDEFSYRRRHRYLTVVVDHDNGRVVWAAPGPQYKTLKRFFSELGKERCARIELASIDMNAGFQKAIREHLPQAETVFDRFHVQQLASRALDEVRRVNLRPLRGTEPGRKLFHTRFALLKRSTRLNEVERMKLREIERSNRPLFRAYLLKEALAEALDLRDPMQAKEAIDRWIKWASRSRLAPFVRTSRTLRKHLRGILAYITTRVSNGVVEGINARLRMIARRAYGFHGPAPLIALIQLCRGGVQLDPPLPGPTRT